MSSGVNPWGDVTYKQLQVANIFGNRSDQRKVASVEQRIENKENVLASMLFTPWSHHELETITSSGEKS